jgi:hypothetical protein
MRLFGPGNKSGSLEEQAAASAERPRSGAAVTQLLPSAKVSGENSGGRINPESNDPELFTTLRGLLAGRNRAQGARTAPSTDSHAYVPNAEDVQAVLGRLQSKPGVPVETGGSVAQRSATHLRQELLTSCTSSRRRANACNWTAKTPTRSISSACCSTTSRRAHRRTATRRRC